VHRRECWAPTRRRSPAPGTPLVRRRRCHRRHRQALFIYFATEQATTVEHFERLRMSKLMDHIMNTRLGTFREAAVEEALAKAQASAPWQAVATAPGNQEEPR